MGGIVIVSLNGDVDERGAAPFYASTIRGGENIVDAASDWILPKSGYMF